jgi:4-alpha-glucanotransferase
MSAGIDAESFDRLAQARGIGRSWYDFRGVQREFPLASRQAILRAMGIDAVDNSAVERALQAAEAERWLATLRPVYVLRTGTRFVVDVVVPRAAGAGSVKWTVHQEGGGRRRGSRDIKRLERVEEATCDGRELERVHLPLPDTIPPGCHRLAVRIDAGPESSTRLIVSPHECHGPDRSAATRLWGLTVQLYTLRSEVNWGIGDFGDLAELVTLAAPLGCSVIGLNPLHALMPANPSHASPYSPSSRQFLNVLYICVPRVPEFFDSAEARARVESPAFAERLRALRATANVDYPGVAAVKLEILRLMHATFRRVHLERDSHRGREFLAWVNARGDALRGHATFDALDAHFRAQSDEYWGWPVWPQAYRDPASPEVARYATDQSQDVEFYLYLQWLTETQLLGVQRAALAAGMAIGLYGDVAVGVNPGGSETWSDQSLYLTGVSIGAPPDPLGPSGQDWGIPPQDPNVLKAQAYAPFVTMVRNGMRCVGALRLDHVMALYRQWWVPRGLGATAGAYVHYPLDDLMGVLALESERNDCVVIGEDLGTVPDHLREAMQSWRVHHYKVLIFEKTPDGSYRGPAEYERNSLATVTTHDLPTVRGWWEGRDIELRASLEPEPDAAARARALDERESDRRALMHALNTAGVWHWQEHEPVPAYSHALFRAIHLYLGVSTAFLAVVQLEDLSGMTDPVNVPGTSEEHANWQRKMNLPAGRIFARSEIREMLLALGKARRGENPNK